MFNKKLNKLVYVAMLVTIHLDLSFFLFLLGIFYDITLLFFRSQ